MSSAINPLFPQQGNPTTKSVRDNFAAAKSEIEALQAAAGGLSNGDNKTQSILAALMAYGFERDIYKDSSPVGMTLYATRALTATGARFWYTPDDDPPELDIRLFDVAGTLIASQMTTKQPNGYGICVFTTPIVIPAASIWHVAARSDTTDRSMRVRTTFPIAGTMFSAMQIINPHARLKGDWPNYEQAEPQQASLIELITQAA